MAVKRVVYIVLGILCAVLAILGTVVPGLPVTPFILLASWLFLRSSRRLYKRLIDSHLGKYVEEYHSKGGLSRKTKVLSILMALLTCGVSAGFFISELWLQSLVCVAGILGVMVIWFFVPLARE